MSFFQKIKNLFGGASSNKTATKAERIEGTVKFFNRTKGFGFIAYDGDKEVFVHKTDVDGYIRKNDKVLFDIAETKKGLAAVKVSRIK